MFYIYHLVDPRNNTPFYVGYSEHRTNGTTRYDDHINEAIKYERIKHHKNQSYNRMKIGVIRKILAQNLQVGFSIICETSDINEIKQLEINEIAKYGRRDLGTGILTNMTDGGDILGSRVISESERKQRVQTRRKNSATWHSESTKEAISKAHQGKTCGPSWNSGKTKETDERLLKMSQTLTGRTASQETKEKLSKMRIGEGNSFYGKTHSEETKKLMSENSIGKTAGSKNGMFGKSAVKGRSWFVNQQGETLYVFPSDNQLLSNGPWNKGRKWK